jgi:hypothetical protein
MIIICSNKHKKMIEDMICKLPSVEPKQNAAFAGLIPSIYGVPFSIKVRKYAKKTWILHEERFKLSMDQDWTKFLKPANRLKSLRLSNLNIYGTA